MSTQPAYPELLGSKNWEGLLNPLDLNLRKLILGCGNFSQSTGDAFNDDTNSKYVGSCRYGMNSLFDKVFLASASDYQIVAFLYASAKIDGLEAVIPQQEIQGAWDNGQSNWMGFIAVTTDDVSKANGRREIYVAWRGTKLIVEALADLSFFLVDAKPLLAADNQSDISFLNNPQVMDGWLKVYTSDNSDSQFANTSARTQLLTKIKELVNQYQNEELSLIFTGHSLGAVLAGLSAFDVAENVTKDIPVAAFVFAMPKLGWPWIGYTTVGTELVLDNTKPPSLTSSQKRQTHDLETLLYTVAGWNGRDADFELKVPRSLGLVNKNSSLIKTEYGYPQNWWVEKNKGMVLDNGDWIPALPFLD
ncbi:hypothetical protein F0562_011383 [Nyssa sinensis]|uniref:Phospholipase A1 n=1 Tax=Nyssa sinensis TaxID=561372 RepID=A0A5J5A3R2_9ASTE|nr:hypothetical protein F0562_011383 [Nyssa sinensis]